MLLTWRIMEENVEKKKFLSSVIIPLCFVVLMWLVKLTEWSFGIDLGPYGLRPHSLKGLYGILTFPFIHGNWEHLLTNSVPILVLGTALFYCYRDIALKVMALSFAISGVLTWCIATSGVHVGASALVYALNLFLIASGFIRRDAKLIAISLIMVFLYGSFLWGMIPVFAKPQNISWEGHLAGFITGVFLAFAYRHKGPQRETFVWEDEEDDNDNDKGNDNGNDEDENGGRDGEKPYWDVPEPDVKDLTVRYRFRH